MRGRAVIDDGGETREQFRRRIVTESWARSEAVRLAPDRVDVAAAMAVDEAEDARRTHALADALPVIRSLLVRDAVEENGLVVAIADASGRLLWVEGAPRVLGLAEALRVVPGADWSERGAGTNAVGTALVLDHRVQIAGSEHFAVQAQQLSCTAVPIHDRDTMETIGVLDVAGGPAAVGPRAMELMQATVAAAERELVLQRLLRSDHRPVLAPPPGPPPQLSVLGRHRASLTVGGRTVPLSLRHAEVLALLAWHRGGLTAERLAELLHGRPDPATVRPEMTRLRRLLAGIAPSLVPLTRPYRLPVPLELDARRLVALLDRGAHRSALDMYVGDLLPSSVAPGIEEIRVEIAAHLREALLSAASPELLVAYADRVVPADPEPLLTALQILPEHSPRRTAITTRLKALR